MCRGKCSRDPQQGVKNSQNAGGHQQPASLVAGIGDTRQAGQFVLDTPRFGLAEPGKKKTVLYGTAPVQVQDQAQWTPARCFAKGMHAMWGQKDHRCRSRFVDHAICCQEAGSAQVTEDLGERMGMPGEQVHFRQMAVHTQPPHPESGQAYFHFLKEEGAVMFHTGKENTVKTKRKSFLCYYLTVLS